MPTRQNLRPKFGRPWEMKVEEGVPIPRMQSCRQSSFSRIANKMKEGDSVLCDSETDASKVRLALYGFGGRAVVRKVEGGWRVWRVSKDYKA